MIATSVSPDLISVCVLDAKMGSQDAITLTIQHHIISLRLTASQAKSRRLWWQEQIFFGDAALVAAAKSCFLHKDKTDTGNSKYGISI